MIFTENSGVALQHHAIPNARPMIEMDIKQARAQNFRHKFKVRLRHKPV